MGLASNLKLTASSLIGRYGSSVTIATEGASGTYNPQTGEYDTKLPTTYTKTALLNAVTNNELQKSGLPDNEWGAVSAIYTMVEDSETSMLNNSWTINNTKVVKVVKTEAQDLVVVVKVYCG